MRRVEPAWLVLLAGVSAALHVGKLPPAVPVLRDALGVSLLQAGFLLSLVQLAGMTLGLAVGIAADSFGPRRTMVLGLLILSGASLLGATATAPEALLVLRAFEGLGVLLAALPAPGLLRRLVQPSQLSRVLGIWSAYMPLGTALALLAGPGVIAVAGWAGWWLLLGGVSLGMAVWLWVALPAHADQVAPSPSQASHGRIRRTLGAKGPWLASLAFATYSAQWLAVVGFLPTIYKQAGVSGFTAAVATALAAAVNMVGNIGSGRLLHRHVPAPWLLQAGYVAMIVGAMIAFAPWAAQESAMTAVLRFGGVLLFSMVGGLVPGTLFSLAVRLAPDEGTVSATVGWMQQWSAFGQFAGPPLAAAVAGHAGGWSAIWWVTCTFAMCGMTVAVFIGRLLQRGPGTQAGAAH